jgi:hypothetical protein
LDGFDGVLGCESPHQQGPLTIGRHADRILVELLHIFRKPNAAAIHSHQKLDDFHDSLSCSLGLTKASKADETLAGDLHVTKHGSAFFKKRLRWTDLFRGTERVRKLLT